MRYGLLLLYNPERVISMLLLRLPAQPSALQSKLKGNPLILRLRTDLRIYFYQRLYVKLFSIYCQIISCYLITVSLTSLFLPF